MSVAPTLVPALLSTSVHGLRTLRHAYVPSLSTKNGQHRRDTRDIDLKARNDQYLTKNAISNGIWKPTFCNTYACFDALMLTGQ